MYESAPLVPVAFGLYLALTFLLAYLARRKAVQGGFLQEFFVGGRTIGPWVLGLTWIATSASGGTFIGAPSLAHANGLGRSVALDLRLHRGGNLLDFGC